MSFQKFKLPHSVLCIVSPYSTFLSGFVHVYMHLGCIYVDAYEIS